MNRPPRQTFLTSAHREPMEKITGTEAFLNAADYALLIFIEEFNDVYNPTGLSQIIGARRVLDILKTIHEPITSPKASRPPALNYSEK